MSDKERTAWMARVKGIADNGIDAMEFKLSDIDLEIPKAGAASTASGSSPLDASSSMRNLSPGMTGSITPDGFSPAPGGFAGMPSPGREIYHGRGRSGSGSCTPSSLSSSLSAMQAELEDALEGKATVDDFPDEMRSDDAIDAMIRSLKNPYCARRAAAVSAYGTGAAASDENERAYQEALAPVPAPAPPSGPGADFAGHGRWSSHHMAPLPIRPSHMQVPQTDGAMPGAGTGAGAGSAAGTALGVGLLPPMTGGDAPGLMALGSGSGSGNGKSMAASSSGQSRACAGMSLGMAVSLPA